MAVTISTMNPKNFKAMQNMNPPSIETRTTEYHGLPVTFIYVDGKRKADIFHPNEYHSDYHIEFAHTTIDGVHDLETAITKATNLLKEYPNL